MFHNYFFLKRLASALHDQLVGYELLECFSQNKDELILGFAKNKDQCYLRANLDPSISLIDISDDFKRAKKNSVTIFDQLIGKEVTDITIFNYERSLKINFTDQWLIFKMHGSRSNILFGENDTVYELFRNKLKSDLHLEPSSLNKELSLTNSHFKELNGDLQ